MKVARFVLKWVALGLIAGAVACAVVAYWDKIMDAFYTLSDKIEEKRASRCCASDYEDDYVDFADWQAPETSEAP